MIAVRYLKTCKLIALITLLLLHSRYMVEIHNNMKHWIQNIGTTVETKKKRIIIGIIILPVVLYSFQFNIGVTLK